MTRRLRRLTPALLYPRRRVLPRRSMLTRCTSTRRLVTGTIPNSISRTQPILLPVAGPSGTRYHHVSAVIPRTDRKGKGRATDHLPIIFPRPQPICNGMPRRLARSLVTSYRSGQLVRHFHSTARRDAIPLLPATIGIVKVILISSPQSILAHLVSPRRS